MLARSKLEVVGSVPFELVCREAGSCLILAAKQCCLANQGGFNKPEPLSVGARVAVKPKDNEQAQQVVFEAAMTFSQAQVGRRRNCLNLTEFQLTTRSEAPVLEWVVSGAASDVGLDKTYWDDKRVR